nr:hypothetical protein [Tanacetum cinerariifolium]
MMVNRIGELEHTLADLIHVNKTMEERLDKHGACLYTLEQLDIPQQVSIAVSEVVTNAVDRAMQAPLRNCFRDLPEADMKEILHQRMWETDLYKSHEVHMQLFEALEKSINHDQSEELAHDLAEARKKKKKSRESPKTPPGSPSHQPPPSPPPAGLSRTSGASRASGSQVTPPPRPPPTSTNQDSPSTGSAAPSPAKTVATTEHQAWATLDVTLKPLVSLTPEDLDLDEAMDKAGGNLLKKNDLPLRNLLGQFDYLMCPSHRITGHQLWRLTIYPLLKTRSLHRLVTLPPLWTGSAIDEELLSLNLKTWKDQLMRQSNVDDPILSHNVSKPLPLGGPPGQVTIQSDFFFNKDLEYLRYGSKGRRPTLSISKMKAAYYPDAGLEQMVPDQFWIEEECKYDIAAMINRMNPGLNTRFWTRKDVDQCNAFMFAIQRRLKTRRIFRNLESFVGGRVREGDYRLLKRTD